MAYSAQHHAVFAQRIKNVMRAIHDAIDREADDLDDIYINETESGTHADYGDADGVGTGAELTNAITAIRAFQVTHAAQLSNITPFLQ